MNIWAKIQERRGGSSFRPEVTAAADKLVINLPTAQLSMPLVLRGSSCVSRTAAESREHRLQRPLVSLAKSLTLTIIAPDVSPSTPPPCQRHRLSKRGEGVAAVMAQTL